MRIVPLVLMCVVAGGCIRIVPPVQYVGASCPAGAMGCPVAQTGTASQDQAPQTLGLLSSSTSRGPCDRDPSCKAVGGDTAPAQAQVTATPAGTQGSSVELAASSTKLPVVKLPGGRPWSEAGRPDVMWLDIYLNRCLGGVCEAVPPVVPRDLAPQAMVSTTVSVTVSAIGQP